MSGAGSLWKSPCDPFPLFFCILREAAHAWRSPGASGRGMFVAAPSSPCSMPQVPFQMENSFALLLWDSGLLFFFIALGFAVTRAGLSSPSAISTWEELHEWYQGKLLNMGWGNRMGFPHIRRQQCHCCECSKVCSSLFGLGQALVLQHWRKLFFLFY